MLGHVGERLGADEEERRLGWLLQPVDPAADLDWDGRPLAEQCERGHEAAVGQSRRVDTLRELAQLAACLVELGSERLDRVRIRPSLGPYLFEEC